MSSWKVIKKYNRYSATYYGDLLEALNKAKRDLVKYKNDKNIPCWIFLRDFANKQIEANKNAIYRAEFFIEAAENELKERGCY